MRSSIDSPTGGRVKFTSPNVGVIVYIIFFFKKMQRIVYFTLKCYVSYYLKLHPPTHKPSQPETRVGEVTAEEDQVFLMAQQVSPH